MSSTTTTTKQPATLSSSKGSGASIAGKTWSVIYPIYLNKKKTLAEGRRVPQDKGLDNPNYSEIAEACRQLGLQAEIEVRWLLVLPVLVLAPSCSSSFFFSSFCRLLPMNVHPLSPASLMGSRMAFLLAIFHLRFFLLLCSPLSTIFFSLGRESLLA
jgi:hypothetical protein